MTSIQDQLDEVERLLRHTRKCVRGLQLRRNLNCCEESLSLCAEVMASSEDVNAIASSLSSFYSRQATKRGVKKLQKAGIA